jgi:hypothetical protein
VYGPGEVRGMIIIVFIYPPITACHSCHHSDCAQLHATRSLVRRWYILSSTRHITDLSKETFPWCDDQKINVSAVIRRVTTHSVYRQCM